MGGAPGGVAYGLKLLYGDNVHVFFAEPVQCPCMLLGLATGEKDGVCVQDAGLTGVTEADGLAVARPSKLVCDVMEHTLSGEFTVADGRLYDDLRALHAAEKLFIEPSACAAFAGYRSLARFPAAQSYLKAHGLIGKLENASHILWATGGRLVPALTRKEYLAKRL